jgi:hypothetical protein
MEEAINQRISIKIVFWSFTINIGGFYDYVQRLPG